MFSVAHKWAHENSEFTQAMNISCLQHEDIHPVATTTPRGLPARGPRSAPGSDSYRLGGATGRVPNPNSSGLGRVEVVSYFLSASSIARLFISQIEII